MGALIALLAAAKIMDQQPARVVSPEVRPDHTVTFRLRAPNAKDVSVDVEGVGKIPLAKGGDGVWSATTKPLAPDLYGYTLSVDGTATFDPANPSIKPNLIYVGNMALVPGNPPEPWEVQDVPHGELHRHFYKSAIIGDQRDYFVYTPPGYRAGLPTLVLLHGFSDTANGWTAVGNAHVILDNLIAQGKARPMVVVMPLGYGVPDFADPAKPRGRDRALENVTKFAQALLEEVLPRVEKDYRVAKGQENRAIAGLSMGGAESLFTGLNHLDRFAYVGAFSAGGLPGSKPEDVLPHFDAKSARGLRLLWMACGTDDGLIGFQRGFAEWVRGKGVRIVTKETPGGHQWPLWRRNLAEFAEMVFKPSR